MWYKFEFVRNGYWKEADFNLTEIEASAAVRALSMAMHICDIRVLNQTTDTYIKGTLWLAGEIA